VHGPDGTKVVRLLSDTGASFTVLPVEVLEAIGCSPAASGDRVRLIPGNGIVIAPRVLVAWLNVLGHELSPFAIMAHTLPLGELFEGLLGMDVLTLLQAQINVLRRTIEVTWDAKVKGEVLRVKGEVFNPRFAQISPNPLKIEA